MFAKRLALLVACFFPVLSPAQPRPNSTVPRSAMPFLPNDVSVGYSYSSDGDLEHGSKVGSVSVSHFNLNYRSDLPVAKGLLVSAGAFWSDSELALSGPVPLPDRLVSFGLNVGAIKDLSEWFGPGWNASLFLRPGFFEGGSGTTGKGFNVPVLLMAGYRPDGAFSVNFGLAVEGRSKYPVLPVAGVRWDFAPDWALSAGFPDTSVSYKISSDIQVKAGARFQGGNYRVKDSIAPGEGDTQLEYREIRVGGGVDFKLGNGLTVKIDAGAVVNRRFDYFNRDYKLNGSTAFYGSLGVSGRF